MKLEIFGYTIEIRKNIATKLIPIKTFPTCNECTADNMCNKHRLQLTSILEETMSAITRKV